MRIVERVKWRLAYRNGFRDLAVDHHAVLGDAGAAAKVEEIRVE
jgi:hypothetical protein